MKIDSYDFGRIVIDGKTYTSDVLAYRERLDTHWWTSCRFHSASTMASERFFTKS